MSVKKSNKDVFIETFSREKLDEAYNPNNPQNKGFTNKTSDYSHVDISNFFFSNYETKLTRGQFLKIIDKVNQKVINKIYDGEIFYIPYSLGAFYVERKEQIIKFNEDGTINYKETNVPTDWGQTNKLWKERPELKGEVFMMYENAHTGGYRMKIRWNYLQTYVNNLKMYTFYPARGFKRGLARYINRTSKVDYYDGLMNKV